MVEFKSVIMWMNFVLCVGSGAVMQVQAATYRNSQNGSYNYLFTIDGFQTIIAIDMIQIIIACGLALVVITKRSFSFLGSGALVVSMAIGANFLASLGLLNNSVLLSNLCTKLDSNSSNSQCAGQEKGIIAFVCLSCGFLMLQTLFLTLWSRPEAGMLSA